MACIIVPAAEALVTTAAAKILRAKGKDSESALNLSHKLGWLNKMLWGGSGLLAFEHVWSGEIIPTFPFLTGAANPVDAAAMLQEMATNGVGMAVLVTGVWCGMVAVSHLFEKKQQALPEAAEANQ